MARKNGLSGNANSPQRPSIPAITLPKGGGAIRGIGEKFAMNPVTGTGSMTIPIATSPGRSGFGPQLTLTYDSGNGNGPFGVGWDLSLPRITRKTDKGLPLYNDTDESDVYLLSGHEDLVPVLESDGSRFEDDTSSPGFVIHRYRPRTESLHSRIERWTNQANGEIHWRTITPDNITSKYGTSGDSRIDDPSESSSGNPPRSYSWLISESRDDKGNAIVYIYEKENSIGVNHTAAHEQNRDHISRRSNRYLKRIKYGNRVSHLIDPDLINPDWMFEVVFDYDEDHCISLPPDPGLSESEQHELIEASSEPGTTWAPRPDPFSTYRPGFDLRTYRRCHRVLMFHRFAELGSEPYLVRSTEFDYGDMDYDSHPTVSMELSHKGSTRYASFIRSTTQAGFVRDTSRPPVERNGITYVTYIKKTLPPIDFEYSRAVLHNDIHGIDDTSLENMPTGIDSTQYRWVDLDGEGISGILTDQADGWFYKPNLGNGRFGPVQSIREKPVLATQTTGQPQFIDLAGDGQLDIADFSGPTPGFFERTNNGSWERFKPFSSLPNIPWDDPNLRFVDLNGDGLADVLLTEHDVFTRYQSLGEKGFDEAHRIHHPADEERGPRLVFDDGTESIFVADMCGDGLNDLVRIRNGEICYWPNLGYGRFGAKITMDNAPQFDSHDRFDHARIRLADIDGSGTTDIIYLSSTSVDLYFNQSGNRWSDPYRLNSPRFDTISSVMTVDLFGTGTTCLVWSSSLPVDANQPLRYIDLLGGRKSGLMVSIKNNLGAETYIHHAPSTTFYLADKEAGNPWVTRLPFPVHVVECVETVDRIGKNRHVARCAYHHGYFDGAEREFRGFGMVEQWDSETFDMLGETEYGPDGIIIPHVPATLTKTWYHTGPYLEGKRVSRQFENEYYREPGQSETDFEATLLPDTTLPGGLSPEGRREACRVLKGAILRQEIYALDGTEKEMYPYSITERDYTVLCLQNKTENRHGVFQVFPRESIEYYYERDPANPRIAHTLTLEMDAYGNVLKSAAVGYGRRDSDPDLSPDERSIQKKTLISYTENDFTNSIDTIHAYRIPDCCETRMYELTGMDLQPGENRFSFEQVLNAGITATPLGYEHKPTPGMLEKRLIEQTRVYFRSDDLSTPLQLGKLESLALPFESYQLAFTQSLVSITYDGRVSGDMLENQGGYVHNEGDTDWWVPSGRIFYSPGTDDTYAQESSYARAHFYLPHRYRNPFHTEQTNTETRLRYDSHDFLIQETYDPLGNRVTAGERDPAGVITRQGNDYRVLQPAVVMDANRNRTEVAFNALGMVAGTAVRGKPEEQAGDTLDGFVPDLTETEIHAHFNDPHVTPSLLLKGATTRQIYDLFAYLRTREDPTPDPVGTYTIVREYHDADLEPEQQSSVQHSFSYSDGFNREIQKKKQAEPGPVEEGGSVIDPRWIGSGWTVFNNKGKPIRKYEPFFSDTHEFEYGATIGISSMLFYDPAGRMVAKVNADNTYEKVVFNAWTQTNWDVNDTILSDPRTDEHIKGFTNDYFDSLDDPPGSWLTWYEARTGGALGVNEQAAASKAVAHSETPTIIYLDPLGRPFLTVLNNGFDESEVERLYRTREELDIRGAQITQVDAKNRKISSGEYEILGNLIHHATMDAGERWLLNDVLGKPIFIWDSRDHRLRIEYDELRRPVGTYSVYSGETEIQIERTVYGENQSDPENRNLRGRLYRKFEQSGIVTCEEYSFKGNLCRSSRQLARLYKEDPDWLADPQLEPLSYVHETVFDALSRPVQLTMPDQSVIKLVYNEANFLQECLLTLSDSPEPKYIVRNIDYNARGQRILAELGNHVVSEYEYDKTTFRLTRARTIRPSAFPEIKRLVQDLRYTYDPAGNVTHIQDDADLQNVIYFRNQRVEPSSDYTYDPLYRLTEATGREHLGQSGSSLLPPVQTDHDDGARSGRVHPDDGNAMGRYTKSFEYDEVGNILKMIHSAVSGGWTRHYYYGESSLLENGESGNRLSSTSLPGDAPPGPYSSSYQYDVNGNMIRMPHLPIMVWDRKNRLKSTSRQVVQNGGTPEMTYYVYDAGGERIRTVTERSAGDGQIPTRKHERLYLGGLELYREYQADGITPQLERTTLTIAADGRDITRVERTIISDGTASSAQPVFRYQHDNHLGSACLELSHDAEVISYEEYYPFGSTSYQGVNASIEASPKRYGYTGKERDEENDLSYFGARYYVPWIGRWTAPDPTGRATTVNLYVYGMNNPIRMVDPDGNEPQDFKQARELIRKRDPSLARMIQHIPIESEHLLLLARPVPKGVKYQPGKTWRLKVEYGTNRKKRYYGSTGTDETWKVIRIHINKGTLSDYNRQWLTRLGGVSAGLLDKKKNLTPKGESLLEAKILHHELIHTQLNMEEHITDESRVSDLTRRFREYKRSMEPFRKKFTELVQKAASPHIPKGKTLDANAIFDRFVEEDFVYKNLEILYGAGMSNKKMAEIYTKLYVVDEIVDLALPWNGTLSRDQEREALTKKLQNSPDIEKVQTEVTGMFNARDQDLDLLTPKLFIPPPVPTPPLHMNGQLVRPQ